MNGRSIAGLAAIGLVLTVVLAGGSSALESGQSAPQFALTDLHTGQTLSLAELEGKWVLLDFWATWCGPCRSAMTRELNPLWQSFGHRSDEWIMVSIGSETESHATQRQYADQQGFGWTFVHDATGEIFDAYGVEFIPTLVLINPEGRVEAMNHDVGSWDRFFQVLQSGQTAEPSGN